MVTIESFRLRSGSGRARATMLIMMIITILSWYYQLTPCALPPLLTPLLTPR